MLGMKGDAYVILAKTNGDVPSLTYDEIFYDNDNNPYVWVAVNNIMRKQSITTGLEGDIYTELKSPVTGTIIVPAKDADKLVDGYKVVILK
jgi:hypothetical protein